MDLQKEAKFFKDIHGKVCDLVESYRGKAEVTKHKEMTGDFATEVDVAVEKLIAKEIHKLFPGDDILAEEEHHSTELSDERLWIIDPICGTTNISRNIKMYCTNIALAHKGQLIASCVIDHSQNDLLWSIGENKVFVNDELVKNADTEKRFGIVIDTDTGSGNSVDTSVKKKLCNALLAIMNEDGYMANSLNSSISFAYTAIGKIDGFINVYCHPWDICAAAFLIQQSGGTITDLDGRPWEISSVGAIAACNNTIHQKLLESYNG